MNLSHRRRIRLGQPAKPGRTESVRNRVRGSISRTCSAARGLSCLESSTTCRCSTNHYSAAQASTDRQRGSTAACCHNSITQARSRYKSADTPTPPKASSCQGRRGFGGRYSRSGLTVCYTAGHSTLLRKNAPLILLYRLIDCISISRVDLVCTADSGKALST